MGSGGNYEIETGEQKEIKKRRNWKKKNRKERGGNRGKE